jgi:transcriptional regulator with XRE-family HTH domain
MKLERSKEWYEKRIALEGDSEIGAGAPPKFGAGGAASVKPLETRMALGAFVELWRRDRGWDAVRLANEAGVGTEEILEIERNPQSEPEPSAVYKLAQLFKMPSQVLMELAGLIEVRTPHLREAAVSFAARSESMAALNQNEREAFKAFVTAIAQTTTKER